MKLLVSAEPWLTARLTASELRLLSRQGFVSSERLASGRPVYKLRFRAAAGRQRVLYVGVNQQHAEDLRRHLQTLQRARFERRELQRLWIESRGTLRRWRSVLAPLLLPHGYVFHGFILRRSHDASLVRHQHPLGPARALGSPPHVLHSNEPATSSRRLTDSTPSAPRTRGPRTRRPAAEPPQLRPGCGQHGHVPPGPPPATFAGKPHDPGRCARPAGAPVAPDQSVPPAQPLRRQHDAFALSLEQVGETARASRRRERTPDHLIPTADKAGRQRAPPDRAGDSARAGVPRKTERFLRQGSKSRTAPPR